MEPPYSQPPEFQSEISIYSPSPNRKKKEGLNKEKEGRVEKNGIKPTYYEYIRHTRHFLFRVELCVFLNMKTMSSSSVSTISSTIGLPKGDTENTLILSSTAPLSVHPLHGKWNMYFHLPADKDNVWTLESYREIKFHIHTAEELISVVRGIQENVVKYGLLFWMRVGIAPFWEDPKNRGMGAFSYKVSNRVVCDVWRHLCYAAAGESLCVRSVDSRHINGLSISPKKGFCCVKIWMDTLEFQDPEMFIDIPGLSRTGCLFRKHI